jgi:hypothetical protein
MRSWKTKRGDTICARCFGYEAGRDRRGNRKRKDPASDRNGLQNIVI